MSLLHPTLGEMIDRLTILDLKIKGDPRPHFLAERDELLAAITAQAGAWETARNVLPLTQQRLAEVNQKLWTTNECIALEIHGSAIARKLWEWNLERWRLIAEINREMGQLQGAEKV